jgi:hypothetical protein
MVLFDLWVGLNNSSCLLYPPQDTWFIDILQGLVATKEKNGAHSLAPRLLRFTRKRARPARHCRQFAKSAWTEPY